MTYKIVTSREKLTTYHQKIHLDTTRDTAILIRQSGKGADQTLPKSKTASGITDSLCHGSQRRE